MSQEPRSLKTAALKVLWSVLASTARVAAVFLVLGVTFVWFFGRACACGSVDRDKAYQAAMRSDLRNLASAQEIYFADSVRYAASLHELDFTASDLVTVTLTLTSDSAWSASASHPGTSAECTIFIGNVEPAVPDAEERSPTCEGTR